jgi:SMP-30/Gluconolactonase/LRE-like region
MTATTQASLRPFAQAGIFIFAAAIAGHAGAQDDEVRRTITAIEARLEQQPNEPTLRFYLAAFQARAGTARDKADALANLARLADIGDGFLPTKGFGFETIWDDAGFKQAYATLEAKLTRVADAPLSFELKDKTLVPEGIAHDPAGGHFYIGSIAQKRILRIDAKGRVSEFSRPADGLQHILGLAVDNKHRRLHAISTSALTVEGRRKRANAIVSYDLKSGRKLTAVDVPGAEQLNDVAVAPGGDLYASDSASGAVWRVREGKLTEFLAPGKARGSNGLAVSADGRRLYIAHSTGIARIDTASGELERVLPPPRQTVAGIDGLYWHGGNLLGIQNVTNPARAIRINLNPDGTQIQSVETLQSHHHPAFDEPTTGAVVGNEFHVLATTQVARFNDQGKIDGLDSLKTPKVLRIPLGASKRP